MVMFHANSILGDNMVMFHANSILMAMFKGVSMRLDIQR